MQFVAAKGGERRRPKRSAPSTYATRSADVTAPSEADMERRFDEMISLTRQNGKWGSSEHLQAFCQAYKVDINVYTMDGAQHFRDVNAGDAQRDVIHIAYHVSSSSSVNGASLTTFRTFDTIHLFAFLTLNTKVYSRPRLIWTRAIPKKPVIST